MSLTGLALIIAASPRLSCSIIVFFLLMAISVMTLAVMHLGKSIIPEKYKTALIIMIVNFFTSLFYLIIDMINPISALEVYFTVFLIPITFLSSYFEKKAGNLSVSEEIIRGAKQASILGGIIIAVSLIREPLGYGTLSLPFSNKPMHLLPESIEEQVVMQVFSAPFGGFIIAACIIALVHVISHEQDSAVQTENTDD